MKKIIKEIGPHKWTLNNVYPMKISKLNHFNVEEMESNILVHARKRISNFKEGPTHHKILSFTKAELWGRIHSRRGPMNGPGG